MRPSPFTTSGSCDFKGKLEAGHRRSHGLTRPDINPRSCSSRRPSSISKASSYAQLSGVAVLAPGPTPAGRSRNCVFVETIFLDKDGLLLQIAQVQREVELRLIATRYQAWCVEQDTEIALPGTRIH